jgi:SAM-dependent methyltransferase
MYSVSGSDSISYERIADSYDEQRGGLVRGGSFAADLAPWSTPRPVLEVGVGTGAVAKPLADLLHTNVAGVDLSPAMAARAKARLGPRMVVGSAESLPIRASKIGTVVFVWVLQVVGDTASAMSEAARVLKTHGRVLAVLAGQAMRRAADMEELLVDWWAALGRSRPDTVEQVRAAAESAGLALLAEAVTTEQEWEQSPNEAAALIEQRAFGPLFELDNATFQRVVQPVADSLRALPAPDQPRVCTASHPLLIFEKTEKHQHPPRDG